MLIGFILYDLKKSVQFIVTYPEQIFEIRNSAVANMCEMAAVQRAAFDRGFYELVLFIEENREEYWNFILTGRE